MNVDKWVISQVDGFDFSKVFVKEQNYEWTYNEFFQCVDSIYEWLNEEKNFEKIIAVIENSVDLFSLFFVSMMYGKTIIPIDPKKNKNEIIDLIRENIVDACVISDDDKIWEKTIPTQFVHNLLFEKSSNADMKQTVLDCMCAIDFNAPYLITFTSGTSGNSKGVVHSLSDLFATSKAFNDVNSMAESAVFGHVMPMTYMAGILNSIIKPFILGAKIVILGRFSVPLAIRFWKVLNEEHINTMWLSPTMINMVLKTDRGEEGVCYARQNNLQFFVGTAALMTSLKMEFEEKYQMPLYVSYGLTETLFISVATRETSRLNDDNVGVLLEGVDITEKEGEALLSVPWMFQGYTNEPTENYFSGQYYMTGDLIRVDERVLYIVGRKKDLIVKGGLNISPAKIESVIMELGLVDDVAVFGKNNGIEELIYCVYVSKGKDGVEKKINQAISDQIGKTHKIDVFCSTDKLIYNLNGKKDKAAISRIIEEMKC